MRPTKPLVGPVLPPPTEGEFQAQPPVLLEPLQSQPVGELVEPLHVQRPRRRQLARLPWRFVHHLGCLEHARELPLLQKREEVVCLKARQRRQQRCLSRVKDQTLQLRLERLHVDEEVVLFPRPIAKLQEKPDQIVGLPLRDPREARLRTVGGFEQLIQNLTRQHVQNLGVWRLQAVVPDTREPLDRPPQRLSTLLVQSVAQV